MALMLALLLCVSAFVSGSETAFFSLTSAQIREMKESRQQSSETIIQLLTHSDRLLATILICNNLVNICITIISARIVDLMFVFQSATWTFVFKTVCVTFLLLLFGEILPKVLANSNPLRVARFAAGPLSVLNAIVKPLASILVRTGGSISNRFEAKRDNLSIDELSNAIDLASTDQTQEERKMLSGIVNFVNTDVAEIMKPRIDIVAVEISDSYSAVKEQIIKSGYSRIPVYEESADNIKGVLYVKDLIPYIHNDDSFEWVSLLRQPYYIPAHKKINDLLEEFQSAKVHMAIVVDEYGSTLGLVSLEDILEEIVGEISDEMDNVETFYTKLADGSYIFEGKTHIGDFERVMTLPEDTLSEVKGEAETLAGLMLEIKRELLKKGDSVTTHGLRLTVTAVDGRRVDKIKVEKVA
ncbi:MAG: gliding motility-associated protein GldE [Rikenellaceae bacterium]|nr:gliding motility-associated protein GldE [Rikenellaceae bacterium]